MGNIEAPRVYNVNVGVLGHVDSGKTSLGALFVAKSHSWERRSDLNTFHALAYEHVCSGSLVHHTLNGSFGQASAKQRKRHHA